MCSARDTAMSEMHCYRTVNNDDQTANYKTIQYCDCHYSEIISYHYYTVNQKSVHILIWL